MALLPITRPIGFLKATAAIADTDTETVVSAPVAGATLVSHHILNATATVLASQNSVSRSGDDYTFHHGAATGNNLHTLVAVFMDAIDTETFQVGSTHILTTTGPITSCQCPCECDTSILEDEFILIGVGGVVTPYKVLGASIDPEDSTQWVYTLGAESASQTLDTSAIDCIRCPGQSL